MQCRYPLMRGERAYRNPFSLFFLLLYVQNIVYNKTPRKRRTFFIFVNFFLLYLWRIKNWKFDRTNLKFAVDFVFFLTKRDSLSKVFNTTASMSHKEKLTNPHFSPTKFLEILSHKYFYILTKKYAGNNEKSNLI